MGTTGEDEFAVPPGLPHAFAAVGGDAEASDAPIMSTPRGVARPSGPCCQEGMCPGSLHAALSNSHDM